MMKRNNKKTLSVGTAVMMVLSTAIPAFADTSSASKFPDITGHWAAGDLSKMTERGIMGGYPDGMMKPEKAVTMAESIKLINKALELKGTKGTSVITYSDVKKDAWYSAEIAIAVENGYLLKVAPGAKLNPNAPATREQLSSMLAEAMKLTVQDTKILDKFKDADQISPALRPQMAAAVEKGLFGGYEDNTLRPKSVVIRATMSAVANRTITEREASKGDQLGVNDMLVDANGTTLSNKTFETVLISPVKGEGVITLDKIVAKKIIVMGAQSAVVIKGESKITEIEYKAASSKIEIQKDSVVTLLTVKAEAKGSAVSGAGILTTANISAGNFKLNTIGTQFKIAADVVGVTTGGTAIPAETSGKTTRDGFNKDAIGGGGGGGGGAVTPVGPVAKINNYKFSATYDGKTAVLDRIAYSETDKMNFDIVSDAYDQIKQFDNSQLIINNIADTLKSVLNLKSDTAQSYITVLDQKITAYKGSNLTVFSDASVKALIAQLSKTAIDGGIVTNENITTLATQIARFNLKDVLSDLGILFPDSELPSQISVKVMGQNISSRKLSAIKETINADLGKVDFKTANGQEVVKVTIGSKSAALVIAVA